MSTFPRMTPPVLREIEADLSSPAFLGVPLGPTLNDSLVIQLWWGFAERRRTYWLSQARNLRYWLLPRCSRGDALDMPGERILMTWSTSTPRFDDMLRPVLDELAADDCAVLYWDASVKARLPRGVPGIGWNEAMHYDVRAWRTEYRRCRPEWRRRLVAVCRRFDLPPSVFELLSAGLLMSSQRVAGCLEFLQRGRPAVVLTEYDRSNLWSCLVLAARRLGIPTVTLVHGVLEQDAVGFSPVLADTVVCWGELERDKLLAAGEPAGKIVIGGCPRLSRDLTVSRAQGRRQLGLDQAAPVVLFATSPGREHMELVELFCSALEGHDPVLAVVRRHPSEDPGTYEAIGRRHPCVRFVGDEQTDLDGSLAAADVVVVGNSGVGGDALVKGRPVVVLSPEDSLHGNDRDLVELAGCPRARTADELAAAVLRVLMDESFRASNAVAAERYVADFCAAFGRDSARRIADVVRSMAEKGSAAPAPGSGGAGDG